MEFYFLIVHGKINNSMEVLLDNESVKTIVTCCYRYIEHQMMCNSTLKPDSLLKCMYIYVEDRHRQFRKRSDNQLLFYLPLSSNETVLVQFL